MDEMQQPSYPQPQQPQYNAPQQPYVPPQNAYPSQQQYAPSPAPEYTPQPPNVTTPTLTPEQKKNLSKRRIFYVVVAFDLVLAALLLFAIISLFLK